MRHLTYKEILDNHKVNMPLTTQWWTSFLFHFTDIHNASRILYDGWIYSRKQALEKDVMSNDNASRAVIEATDIDTKCYGRLYFRPLTPTQYHNEGYKPSEIRNTEINASCPVPIFFCLSSNATLNYPGTKYAEKGISGHRHQIAEGIEEFTKLNFSKIYHNGPYSMENSDIKEYRHSEVIREGGFPVEPLLKCILCRTSAEKETLLFLLNQFSARLYNTYKDKVFYKPSLPCFYNNGIFIKRVYIMSKILMVEFNDPELRLKKAGVINPSVRIRIEIIYKNIDGQVLSVSNGIGNFNYYNVRTCSYELREDISYDTIRVMIQVDDAIMYENELDLNDALF